MRVGVLYKGAGLVLLLSVCLIGQVRGQNVARLDSTGLTEAEKRVQEIVRKDGVHVVHFWAPWCGNSIAELEAGWSDLIEANEDVTFTYVTIWNNGRSGLGRLQQFGVGERVEELVQPDFGPSADRSQRRYSFLGLPVTWVPSTWIFHRRGEPAFLLNFGEMDMHTIQHLIDTTRNF